MYEKANRSDAHQTVGLERTVLLKSNKEKQDKPFFIRIITLIISISLRKQRTVRWKGRFYFDIYTGIFFTCNHNN